MIPPMESEDWEKEVRRLIRKFLCSIHAWHYITISQAQIIFGEYLDADRLIQSMLSNKDLMLSGLQSEKLIEDSYQFTFQGLQGLFTDLLPEAKEKFGDKPTEIEFATFVLKECVKIAGPRPGQKV